MASAPTPPQQEVHRYLQTLWLRAALFYGVRASCVAAGAFGLVLLGMSLATGPVVSAGWARGLLGLAVLLALGAGGYALSPLSRVSRRHRHRLLAERDAGLASRARSALELGAPGTSSHASTSLVLAHAAAVRDAVRAAPPREVVPVTWLRHPSVMLGLTASLFTAATFQLSEGARIGARALLSPATLSDDGTRVAPIVESLYAKLIFPSYLERAPESVSAITQLAVPRGTTVELRMRPLIPARHGAIAMGEEVVRLTPDAGASDGALVGRFVARQSTPLLLRVLHDEVWYQDSTPRALSVQDDRAPEVRLTSGPIEGAVVQLDSSVTLGFEASDDHGLAALDLALRLPSGEETRERLWSSIGVAKPMGQMASAAEIAIAKLGVGPGDIVLAWIEARDADVVSGPHVGVSRTVTLEIATDSQEISRQIPALREVLDRGLDLLAARLEQAIPEPPVQARQRFDELHGATEAWIGMLVQLIEGSKDGQLDADQLRGIADRTRRELAREGSAYEAAPNAKRYADVDARMVVEHERDVLLLADMLASALVDEARAITSELNAIKEHMRELLKQLKDAPSEAAKRELLAELAKAQRRLRDLAQSMSKLAQRVPSEFINQEAIPQSEAKSSMDGLQAAIEAGDMEEAERQLEALANEIDQLAAHVDQGGSRFRESRFGAHDKAVAQARNQLSMLAAEQERLAGRSREIVQDAARKAQARAGGAGQDSSGMQQLAQGAQSDLEALGQPDSNSGDGQLLGQARERTRDISDALRTGDLAEARRMAAAAQRSLDTLARGLQQEAQMFPGHNGETAERAQAAGEAAGKLQKLQQQLDQSMPPLDGFMGEGERTRMRGDVPPQRSAREMAEKLSSEMGDSPSNGRPAQDAPISPDAQRGLSEVSDAMQRAEQALAKGDADEASRAQEEAADQLRQLEQSMAQKGQGKPGGEGPPRGKGQERAEREGEGGRNSEGPVRIPGADEFKGPVEMRRRVLDAMREESPNGFQSALQRYYEGLLQ